MGKKKSSIYTPSYHFREMRKLPISRTGHPDESQTHTSWIQRQGSSKIPTNSTNPIQKAGISHTALHWGRNPIWCGCPITINIYGRQSQEQASRHIPSYSNEFPVGFDHVAHVLWHYATMARWKPHSREWVSFLVGIMLRTTRHTQSIIPLAENCCYSCKIVTYEWTSLHRVP